MTDNTTKPTCSDSGVSVTRPDPSDLLERAREFSIVWHGAPRPLIDELIAEVERLREVLRKTASISHAALAKDVALRCPTCDAEKGEKRGCCSNHNFHGNPA